MMNNKICDFQKCTGCAACSYVCPKQCIKMLPDDEGFLRPKIDTENCINCKKCKKICPANKQAENIDGNPSAYAFQHSDAKVRLSSSSGGAFWAIATRIIEKGGVVLGAAFDSSFNVKHICCESLEQLLLLQGSKYVQSNISESFEKIKQVLSQDREVLFCGTPCQVAAVKSIFGKEHTNLIAIDLVCHGISSPAVWSKYIEEREHTACAKVTEVSFRHKSSGWKKYSVRFVFDNGKEYCKPVSDDTYMRAFLGHVMLRSSCHICPFRNIYRQSDLTLADFWGIEKVVREYNDDKGTSLILVNSAKGMELIRDISQNGNMKEVDFESAIAANASYFKSAVKAPYRAAFQHALNKRGMDYAVNKYFGSSIVSKARRFFWKTVSKL